MNKKLQGVVKNMLNCEINKNRHSCFLLQYHLVVVTKYRHKVIVGDLKERLLKLTKNILDESWK